MIDCLHAQSARLSFFIHHYSIPCNSSSLGGYRFHIIPSDNWQFSACGRKTLQVGKLPQSTRFCFKLFALHSRENVTY